MISPFVKRQAIALVKRNTIAATPRYGYSVYTPIDASGIWWANWHMSNRSNPSTIGCVRLLDAKISKLCASTRYALVFNAPQRSDGWAAITTATITDIDGVYCPGASGENVTYTVVVPANGRIIWEHIRTTVSGRAYVEIRDSDRTEIAAARYDIATDGTHRYVDTYEASNYNEIYRTSLASALPAGTYTVLITASGVVSPHQCIYERCCFAIDDAVAGNPYSTDPFVDQGSPSCVIGAGNSEYMCRMAQTGASFADQEYASGVYGYEAGPNGMTMTADGADIKAVFDLATTYQGTRWCAGEFQISYATTVRTRVGSINQATIGWQHRFLPGSYLCNLYRTTLIATDYAQECVGMLVCPNLPNGGTNQICIAGTMYVVGTTTPVEQGSCYPAANRGGSLLGPGWRASVAVAAPANLEGVYQAASEQVPKTLITDCTDGYIKDFRATIMATVGSLVVPVAAGDVCGVQLQYRVEKV